MALNHDNYGPYRELARLWAIDGRVHPPIHTSQLKAWPMKGFPFLPSTVHVRVIVMLVYSYVEMAREDERR